MYISDRNHSCRITFFSLGGVGALALENRWLRVTVLVDKGTDICEFLHKPTDTDFMWRSPTGLPSPQVYGPSHAFSASSFLDSYHGGWQEMFPVCGSAADFYGMPVGVHGEVCLQPWRWMVEEDSPETVVVRFDVTTLRSPFRLTKRFRLTADTPALFIRERAENLGAVPVDFMWGHHPAFGAPFIQEGCRIDTDARRVLTTSAHSDPNSRLAPDQEAIWPMVRSLTGESVDLSRVPGPGARLHDWAYLTSFSEGWYAVTNPARQVGFALRWPARILPYALYWQQIRGGTRAPWFGRAYCIALEPQSSFPADYAAGQPLLRLEPGEVLDLDLTAIAYNGLQRVEYVEADGQVR